MEWLKGLDPSTLLVVGVVLILREVFAFIKDRTRREQDECNSRQASDATAAELKAVVGVLQTVRDNIEAQTHVTRDLFTEVKLMRSDVNHLSDDMRRQMV